jgi:hypothetical protein
MRWIPRYRRSILKISESKYQNPLVTGNNPSRKLEEDLCEQGSVYELDTFQ